ncbi:sporulation protein YqfD [Alkalibacillus haloalkaliphilus]|uniref:sporulation protein YqfD n=1 Tax=Alkalibacillus haloalkaliphilus TaxID=94136 RepID=UPI002935F324|nr:sporulation protein YqfD [Alkalibacillus haloalkaliphilus]MDV2581024.1 sporulation protein YqfD [Alkalibacillus haloalkaliphilus]
MSYRGIVEVVVEGGQVESFLNNLIEDGVKIEQIKRIDEQAVKMNVDYLAIPYLKAKRKQYGCKIKFNDRSGIPTMYSKRKKWLPPLIGVVLSFLFILLLSNVVWNITVEGGSPETRYEVNQLLDTLGLKEGNWVQNMEDISTIEREIMNSIDEVSYVGISKSGSSYNILIEESETMEQNVNRDPTNLVASKAGTVDSMFIVNGRPVVQINDFVEKGDLLVTGELDEDGEVLTYAEGEVIAEVWYEVNVEVDFSQYLLALTPDATKRYSVSLFNSFEWMPRGAGDRRLLLSQDRPIYFLNWELPISFHEHYFYTEEEAVSEVDLDNHIHQAVEEQLKRQLGQSVDVTYQKVLHEDRYSDKVKLEMFVKVLEDITEEQIIDQGD